MLCEYIYKEGDEPVVKGIAKIGSRCGSGQAKPETRNLCYGHYQSWLRKNDPDKLKPVTAKRQATIAKMQAEGINKNAEIIKEAATPGNKYGIDNDILEEMGLSGPVDLEIEYAHYKMLGIGEGQENYEEKMAFARWLSVPETERTPTDIKEAAKILGVTVFVLECWRRSPEIIKFKNRNVETVIDNSFRMVFYEVLKGVKRGDPRYVKIYMEMKANISDNKKDDKLPKLPDNIIEMANKHAENGGERKLTGTLADMEKATIFEQARDGNLQPNEVKN